MFWTKKIFFFKVRIIIHRYFQPVDYMFANVIAKLTEPVACIELLFSAPNSFCYPVVRQ